MAGLMSPIPPKKPWADLPPGLVQAVIQQESQGDPNAVSKRGAGGLMQIMPQMWADPGYGVPAGQPGMRMDPASNVELGTNYLRALYGRYGGDLTRTLAAYNMGPGNADKWTGSFDDLPAETRRYVSRVSERMTGDRPTYSGGV